MRLFNRDQADKINSLNRCYFDMEHGWISLALDRLADLNDEFPDDPEILYVEGDIRKRYLGQGLKAEALFLKAQSLIINRTAKNENYFLATFNSAKCARNLEEYCRQESIVRKLAPNEPGLRLLDQINLALANGTVYADALRSIAVECQQHANYGNCAAFAEIALQAADHNLDEELGLRSARFDALRQLDKAAAASRQIRGEVFAPNERLMLKEAMAEINIALSLDPNNHIHWNLKSAWHIFFREFSQALSAADKAIELCPEDYYKAKINKAIALAGLDRKDEAMTFIKAILDSLERLKNPTMNDKNDRELAESIIRDLSVSPPLRQNSCRLKF